MPSEDGANPEHLTEKYLEKIHGKQDRTVSSGTCQISKFSLVVIFMARTCLQLLHLRLSLVHQLRLRRGIEIQPATSEHKYIDKIILVLHCSH